MQRRNRIVIIMAKAYQRISSVKSWHRRQLEAAKMAKAARHGVAHRWHHGIKEKLNINVGESWRNNGEIVARQ